MHNFIYSDSDNVKPLVKLLTCVQRKYPYSELCTHTVMSTCSLLHSMPDLDNDM